MTTPFQDRTIHEKATSSPSACASLDHVTLRVHDLEGIRRFLEDLLDLKVGFRPDFSFPGYWLYAGDEPLVHLIPGERDHAGHRGDAIDHVGFRLTDTMPISTSSIA